MLARMAEKRRAKRYPKRLRVRFGEAKERGFPHIGITSDVSPTGLFVICARAVAPDTRLHLEVTLPGESLLYLEVVTTRQYLVPTELRQVVNGGFGARYLTGGELLAAFFPGKAEFAARPASPFTQVIDSPAAWKELVARELKRGGVFLWVAEAVKPDAVVTVTFDLRFSGQRLEVPARVVHCAPGPDGRQGVALMFTDPSAVDTLTASAR